MENSRNIIEARNVKRRFKTSGGELWALKGIDMDIATGGLTILKGRSGSGKTTLLNILSALDKPTDGSVMFLGRDIAKLDEKERTLLRRREIGFVFQSVALVPMMSAAENVEFALRMAGGHGDNAKRAAECLHMVGLSNRMTHLPQEMSGGEQQRVAIARALAHNPKVIFADEPTGELDTMMALHIVRIFQELTKEQGVTIVMTTHDPGLMDVGDALYELEDGEVVHE